MVGKYQWFPQLQNSRNQRGKKKERERANLIESFYKISRKVGGTDYCMKLLGSGANKSC